MSAQCRSSNPTITARIGGELGDQLEDGDEQPAVRRAVSSGDGRAGREPVVQRRERRRLGQQIRLRPADLAQQIGERRQRNGVAADVRGPPEVEGDAGARGALADDRRLADAGVTAHQHDRRQPVARIRDRALEDGQLGAPADEVRCGQAVVDDAAQYRVPRQPAWPVPTVTASRI